MTTLDSSTIVQPVLVEELSLPKSFAEDVVVSARHDVRCVMNAAFASTNVLDLLEITKEFLSRLFGSRQP
jgi:hypothetical protein